MLRFRYFLIALLLFCGCATVSPFDHHAYVQTTSAKVDALYLMDMGTESYYLHEAEVRQVRNMMDKLYEYERNRPNNEITVQMWDILRDTSGNLFGGFIRRWKQDTTLRPAFVGIAKKQVGEAFDKIARLESKKIKPKDAR